MVYMLVAGVVLLILIVMIMVKLWKGYYGEKHVPLMSEEERSTIEERLELMGSELPIRVRQLFEGEVLWAEGSRDTWRWSWEAGKRGAQTYARLRVTFIGGLGQGIVLERGGRERMSEESPAAGALGPRLVLPEPGALPEHFLCKARDEERFHAFLSRARRKRIRVLDGRVSSFSLDDRGLFVQRHDVSDVNEISALLELTQGFVEDVIAWSAAQGVLAALETGQYQGALAELEQSTIRDISVLEEQEVSGAREALPRAPT